MVERLRFAVAVALASTLWCHSGMSKDVEGTQLNTPASGRIFQHQKTIQEGNDDDLPKNYSIIPFVINEMPSCSSLSITSDGRATIGLNTESRTLKTLNKALAIKIFGDLQYVRSNDTCHTFHVVAFHPEQGPNIFHIDVEFNNLELLTRYRVRGFGILNPEWQKVQ